MAIGRILRRTLPLLAALCASLCSTAHASPLLELVGDTAGLGLLQARNVPGGSAAAYFNPALLTDVDQGLTFGFCALSQRIGVKLDGRPGTGFAIPEGLSNAGHADFSRFDNYPIATDALQFGREKMGSQEAFEARPRQGAGSGHETYTYEVVGLVAKLFDDRLAVGFHGMIPNGEFTQLRAFYNDEREQYFSNSLHPELYGDRLTALSMALGAGVRLTDELSLGVGTTFALEANVVAPTYVVDTGDLERILIDMDSSVNIGLAPHMGVSYRPHRRLRFTATAHAPQKVELNIKFTFLLASGVEQTSGLGFTLDYLPFRFSLGGAYDLIADEERTLTLAAGAQYAAWGTYQDRHGARPSPAYAWADTIAPTLGVRYASGAVQLGFDATYVPTPVPEQTGRTNYVDNDRLSTALGAQYGFELFGTQVAIGLQAQLHSLVPRHQTKIPTPTQADGENIAPELVKDELPDDAQISGTPLEGAAGLQTNNPGWPGFSSGGFILDGTLYAAVKF